jgi:hypothetical protein
VRGTTFYREETRISSFENFQAVPDPPSALERSKKLWQVDFIMGKKKMLSRVLSQFV